MVATVTGIAPFVSMLRHAIHRGERRFRFVVLQGASYLTPRGFLVKEEKYWKE